MSRSDKPRFMASNWSSAARPKLAREVFLLRREPTTDTIDTWERALIEKARRLPIDQHLPVGKVNLRDNLQYDRFYQLNHSSAQIVAWCNGQRTVLELEQAAAEKFGWTPEQARQAVKEVLTFLTEKGMLEGPRRSLRRLAFVLNPFRVARVLEYIVGYHLFHKYH